MQQVITISNWQFLSFFQNSASTIKLKRCSGERSQMFEFKDFVDKKDERH
jgi:hypothetical protein